MTRKGLYPILVGALIFIFVFLPILPDHGVAMAQKRNNGGVQETDTGWQIEKLMELHSDQINQLSLVLDSQSYPHLSVSVSRSSTEQLVYIYQDVTGWYTDTVDTDVTVWGLSLALDANNTPQIGYLAYPDEFRYAYKDIQGWHIEKTQLSVSFPQCVSIDLAQDGQPHIGYYDQSSGELKYAYRDAQGWHFETVAPLVGFGIYPSIELKIDSSGHPHLGYYDPENRFYRYAYKDELGWQIKILSQSSMNGASGSLSLAIDHQNQPHFSHYIGEINGLLYSYQKRGEIWTRTIPSRDSLERIGGINSLTLNAQNLPLIAYSAYNDNLKVEIGLAYQTCPEWHKEIIESDIQLTDPLAAAVDQDGKVFVSYLLDYGQTLKVASKQLSQLVAGCANLPSVMKPYPIFIQPGSYPVNRCVTGPLWVAGIGIVGDMQECVTGVEILNDSYHSGFMKFNFKWKVYLDEVSRVGKNPDEYNENMYITDNLGNRYDHVEVGGAAKEYVYLYDEDTVEGWFLFEPAKAGAMEFTFHDDDMQIVIDGIVLAP